MTGRKRAKSAAPTYLKCVKRSYLTWHHKPSFATFVAIAENALLLRPPEPQLPFTAPPPMSTGALGPMDAKFGMISPFEHSVADVSDSALVFGLSAILEAASRLVGSGLGCLAVSGLPAATGDAASMSFPLSRDKLNEGLGGERGCCDGISCCISCIPMRSDVLYIRVYITSALWTTANGSKMA